MKLQGILNGGMNIEKKENNYLFAQCFYFIFCIY